MEVRGKKPQQKPKFLCSNLSLFGGERGAVGLQVLHDALHAAGAEQPEKHA